MSTTEDTEQGLLEEFNSKLEQAKNLRVEVDKLSSGSYEARMENASARSEACKSLYAVKQQVDELGNKLAASRLEE